MKLIAKSRLTVALGIMVIFLLGYLCGSMSQQNAVAQVPGLGGVLDKAGKMGGPVGSAAQLGSSIVEMQDHVTGLQKNIDTLKKVQSALTGN
jgi:hypothetical protein